MAALSDTSDTTFRHVLLTDDGGQIRFFANHGRLYVTKQSRDGRQQVTTPVSLERARFLAHRVEELCVVAEAFVKEPV